MVKSEKEYTAIIKRIEELHHPVQPPTLAETIKMRMHERGLNQKALSQYLGVSSSRISEYLNGKSEPTLKVSGARPMPSYEFPSNNSTFCGTME